MEGCNGVDAYLAIDEGTTNCKAVLIATDGTVLSTGSVRLDLRLPAPGEFEQDGAQIIDALRTAIDTAISGTPDAVLVGVAVANQRESVIAFDRATGTPLSPVIGWQDSRTADRCAALATPELTRRVRETTGLHLDPMYSATKMAWLRDSLGDAAAHAVIGTIDAFVLFHLTGGATIACDETNAARTLLMDLRTRTWDTYLTEALGVPAACLPEIRPSGGDFGVTTTFGSLPAGLPIRGVLGDSHAALFGQRCEQPGVGKVTFGTGSSVMIPTLTVDTESAVDTTLGFSLRQPVFAREGNVLSSGAAFETMAAILGVDGGRGLSELASQADSSAGVCVVPAFSGLAAPHWDRDAVGVVTGIGRDTTPAQIALATLESVGHQLADIVDEIRASGDAVTELRADGGASIDALMMQIQADLIGCDIVTSQRAELAAIGAARMAAYATGRGDEFDSTAPTTTRYTPSLSDDERSRRRAAWTDAVARSRGLEVPQERTSHV